MVHASLCDFSKQLLLKHQRCNYATSKSFLDFISSYSTLLEEKNEHVLGLCFFLTIYIQIFCFVKRPAFHMIMSHFYISDFTYFVFQLSASA